MDWSGWMTATPQQQEAMRQRYRNEIRRESEAAKASNYAGLSRALAMTPEAARAFVAAKRREAQRA